MRYLSAAEKDRQLKKISSRQIVLIQSLVKNQYQIIYYRELLADLGVYFDPNDPDTEEYNIVFDENRVFVPPINYKVNTDMSPLVDDNNQYWLYYSVLVRNWKGVLCHGYSAKLPEKYVRCVRDRSNHNFADTNIGEFGGLLKGGEFVRKDLKLKGLVLFETDSSTAVRVYNNGSEGFESLKELYDKLLNDAKEEFEWFGENETLVIHIPREQNQAADTAVSFCMKVRKLDRRNYTRSYHAFKYPENENEIKYKNKKFWEPIKRDMVQAVALEFYKKS